MTTWSCKRCGQVIEGEGDRCTYCGRARRTRNPLALLLVGALLGLALIAVLAVVLAGLG